MVDPPVGDRAVPAPGVKDRTDRLVELHERVLREGLSCLGQEVALEDVGQFAQRIDVEFGVEMHTVAALELRDFVLDVLPRDPVNDVGEHLHEAPVAVPGKALVAGRSRQPLHRGVVEPEVQDGVHHARHRLARSGAHRQQQRIVGVAETATDV